MYGAVYDNTGRGGAGKRSHRPLGIQHLFSASCPSIMLTSVHAKLLASLADRGLIHVTVIKNDQRLLVIFLWPPLVDELQTIYSVGPADSFRAQPPSRLQIRN